jgi:hypothetical protein
MQKRGQVNQNNQLDFKVEVQIPASKRQRTEEQVSV